jgi:SnoaL-like polyketide cyclase
VVLEVSPDRPLARLVVRAVTGRDPGHGARRGPYAPPRTSAGRPSCDLHDPGVVALCESLLHRMLVGGGHTIGLEDEMLPDVVAWSPSMYVSSREATIDVLEEHEPVAEALTEVTVVVNATDVVPPRVYLEWRLEGRFTSPCFVEDDLLIEPTGQLVETAGVLVVTFADDRVSALHCYYDGLAVLEQLVAAR